MSEQQAVAGQADGQPEAAPETGGAQEKSVDELLKEFDTKATPEPKAETKPDTSDDRLNTVFDWVEQKAKEEKIEQVNNDIADAVKTTVGDHGLDPEYVEGKLHYKANTDPKFARAWMSRHDNPDQFNQVLRQYGKELAGKANSNIDQNATEDRAALSAAVRSQSQKSADPPPMTQKDLSKMSDAEFNKMKREMFGR